MYNKKFDICLMNPPYNAGKKSGNKDVAYEIMNRNLVCSDFFEWNFEEWRPYTEDEIKLSKKI